MRIAAKSTTSWSAAPTIAGRNPKNASSINPTLTAMPSQIASSAIRTVRLAMATLVATRPRSSSMITTSADSLAAVAPLAPIAMPTSAAASTGASFTPSPTMATGRSGNPATATTLPSGSRSARTSETPTCSATWFAFDAASPVTISNDSTPRSFSASIVARALTRTWSVSRIRPI